MSICGWYGYSRVAIATSNSVFRPTILSTTVPRGSASLWVSRLDLLMTIGLPFQLSLSERNIRIHIAHKLLFRSHQLSFRIPRYFPFRLKLHYSLHQHHYWHLHTRGTTCGYVDTWAKIDTQVTVTMQQSCINEARAVRAKGPVQSALAHLGIFIPPSCLTSVASSDSSYSRLHLHPPPTSPWSLRRSRILTGDCIHPLAL